MMSKLGAILARRTACSSDKRRILGHGLWFAQQLSRVRVRGGHCCGGMKVVPSREEHLNALKGEEFDVLVIGGGAVGCGCAVDAACRGLKTALIEADDFASGSSSRSSKLIDGSGSYLGTALREKDIEQLYIMLQMMSERVTMLKNAPHLNRIQPMIIPIYSVLQMPCTWLGLKVYDFISAASNVRGSHLLSREATLYEFPLLKTKGLRGGVVYYDGQVDDARMCIALVMTAVALGANVGNHMEVVELMPMEGCCRVVGVRDKICGEQFYIQAKSIINATGTNTDAIRQMDKEGTAPILAPTVGTHVSLPRYFGSGHYGLLSPAHRKEDLTIFMVPFENHTVLGIRETEMDEVPGRGSPTPDPDDVDCLLEAAKTRMEPCVELGRCHVLSAWTGVKPNVSCPTGKSEEEEEKRGSPISSYVIEVSEEGLITLAGGRFSSYRVMAADAVDMAIKSCGLCDDHVTSSWTQDLKLDGAESWCCMLPLEFVQDYDVPMDVAQHISDSYGWNGHALFSDAPDLRKRLHPNFPYIEAEVQYAVRNEYACTLVDIIARRLRIAFVDAAASLHMLPKILKIMAEEKGWEEEQQQKQMLAAQEFLVRQMGLGTIVRPRGTSKSQPKKKASSEGCCCRAAARKEARSYSRGHPRMVVASKDDDLKPVPIHRYSKDSFQPLATQKSNKNVRKATDFLPFTSGITHQAVVDNDRSKSIASGGWSVGKRELIINAWRNKFMC
ncbi:glycerol-3-phosphate dehydrogenase, mitochondrial [Drosophila biarmipes]|uniref:glycerol-3-phosphate dehydrogenase, mitochondrial n=1 Tax=Drosophila biarmipes TaxID=125945 RepID=UPI0007E7AAF1|nr:glycerol-3-phosphate dehydrogenase, mitochondrial [Drosophila biarmipes]